jgi:hypothetical protein
VQRRTFTCAGLCAALALAGCGGGGGASSLPPPVNVSAGGAAGSAGAPSGSASGAGAATIPQTHVLTADYLGGYAGTHSVSAGQAAPVLSWAEVDVNDANAISAAGIKTLDYIDPWRQASGDPVYTSDESTFSHDCSGNRIAIPISGQTQYLMNPSSVSLESLVNSWESRQLGTGHVDAFFFDDTDSLAGISAQPCNVSQGAWDAATAAFVGSSNRPVVFNGYEINSDSAALIDASNVVGGMVEQCYASTTETTAPYTTGSDWARNENLELAAASSSRFFFCYNNPTTDAASSVQVRQYVYASFLLTYSPSSSVLWEYFSTPSGLHVFPESQLVPADPLVTGVGSIGNLESSTGLYVREYAACYLAGKNVGPCAAVVNPDPSLPHPRPSLSRSYGHTLALSGHGILDGGSASVSGPAAPSTLPPATGLILLQ